MESVRRLYTQYQPFVKEPVLVAFTAVVCLYLAQWLKLPQGYWAVMSSIIVMQGNVEETISASLNRLTGTAIGAFIGGIFLDLYGIHVWVFGVAVMITVLICIFLKLKQSYRLASVTVAIIILVNHPESPWMTAVHRFLEVSLGVVVALLISLLSNPSYSSGLFQGWKRKNFKTLGIVLMVTPFIMAGSSYADWNAQNNGINPNANNGHSQGSGHSQNSGQGSGNSGHGSASTQGHDDGHGHKKDHSYVGVDFSLWPNSYYYNASYYSPPEDVVISAPPVYEPVVINGITYYFYNGTYYIYNGYGYQEAAPPVTVVQQPEGPEDTVQPPPAALPSDATQDPSDSFTINIPNDNGGYTAVILKKSGTGFIGPQGEFYPEFPTVYQLKVMYGK